MQQQQPLGNFNDSVFFAKRELDAELRRAVPRQLPQADTDEYVYVLEWYDFVDVLPTTQQQHFSGSQQQQRVSRILGCGIGSKDGLAKYMITNCRPGLYVCSWQLSSLRAIASIYGYSVETYEHLGPFVTNNFTVFDALHAFRDCSVITTNSGIGDDNDNNDDDNDDDDNNVKFERPATLCKIITPTFEASQELHKVLRFQYIDRVKEYAAIPFYWDISRFMLYELRVKRSLYSGGCNNSDTNDHFIKVWLNGSLETPNTEVMRTFHVDTNMPYVTFDVETSSNDPYRVPTGEDVDDILVTAAVYHQHTQTMYSLVYLPIKQNEFYKCEQELRTANNGGSSSGGGGDNNNTVDDSGGCARQLLDSDNSNKPYHVQLEYFFNERDILTRTVQLLEVPHRYHYLVGYNSANYDIKYLLTRCVFYGLTSLVERFVYKHCYAYGVAQIHIDMFRVALMRYDLKDYKLSTVAQSLLATNKDDVNAVDIRYTFAGMREAGCVPDYSDAGMAFLARHSWPCMRDIINYNEKDTLLVFDIALSTSLERYLDEYALDSGIAISSINENYKRVKYPLICWCERILLRVNAMLSHFKESTRQLKIPVARYVCDPTVPNTTRLEYDYRCVKYDSTTLLGMRQVQHSNKRRYPGGVNYCYGAFVVNNVVEYDYVQAYLHVIDKLNLSDETCAVVKASVLRALLAAHSPRRRALLARHKFRVFDYRTHNGDNKVETRILMHQFIEENVNCGSEFDLADDEELARRGDEPVILILCDRQGVLSQAVKTLVDNRKNVKEQRNMLESFLPFIADERLKLLHQLVEEQGEAEEAEEEEAEGDTTNTDDNVNYNDNGEFSDYMDTCGVGMLEALNNSDDFTDVAISSLCEDLSPPPRDDMAASPLYDEAVASPLYDEAVASPLHDEASKSPLMHNNSFGSQYDTCGNKNDDCTDTHQSRGSAEVATAATNSITAAAVVSSTYSFENEYVSVHSTKLRIAMPSSWDTKRRIEFLDATRHNINIEIANYTNRYTRLKTITLSVYGIVGSLSTELAAIITAIPRMTLIQQAQLLANKGRRVYYLDTDCIHTDGEGVNESQELNSRFSYAQLSKKNLGVCIYQCCKTYYCYMAGAIKYGANRRGPAAWRYMIEFFDKRARDIAYIDEVRACCRDFFVGVYERVHEKCCTTGSLESGFEFLTREIKLTTNAPTVVFRDYLLANYPEMASTLRQRVFLIFDHENITSLIFRPAVQLFSSNDHTLEHDGYFYTSTGSSGGSNDDKFTNLVKVRLLNVNLFKFFLPVITTCYNIVFSYCRENNQPFHVILHPRHFNIMLISGFLDAMRTMIERWRIDNSLVPLPDLTINNMQDIADNNTATMTQQKLSHVANGNSLFNADDRQLEQIVGSVRELDEKLF